MEELNYKENNRQPISGRNKFRRLIATINNINSNVEPIFDVNNEIQKQSVITPDATFVTKPVTLQPIIKNINTPTTTIPYIDNKENDISKTLYNSNLKALSGRGYDTNKLQKLAIILTQQQMLESGWGKHTGNKNNYGGMRTSKGYIPFDSVDDYTTKTVQTLDTRWPTWTESKDAIDYAKRIHSGKYKYSALNSTTYGNRMNGVKNRLQQRLGFMNNNNISTNRRHLAYGGTTERPKAFWGALVGGLINLASSYIQSRAQYKAQREAIDAQNKLQEEQNTINEQLAKTKALNNYADSLKENPYKDYTLTYKNGGKVNHKSIKRPILITDGGFAENIGNNTYLLRGSSHEDINESGNTGIGISIGNKELEAEGGEIAQVKKNQLRIFSGAPILNGISPVDAILSGANKDKVFAAQERFKQIAGLNDDGSIKNSSPVKEMHYGRDKHLIGGIYDRWNNKINDNPPVNKSVGIGFDPNKPASLNEFVFTVPKPTIKLQPQPIITPPKTINFKGNTSGMSIKGADWIGLGTDLIGSIGSGLLQIGGLKGLTAKYTLPTHIDESPVSLDTVYHNEAQRAAVERNRLNTRQTISDNTASSVTALNNMQQADTNALIQENQLWNEKENKEAELRNQNKLNEQQVRARNTQSMNENLARIAQIKNAEIDTNNQLAMQRMKARQFTLQGIAGAANNFLNQTRQRYEDEQAMRYALAASEKGTAYKLLNMGVDLDQQTLRGLYNNAIRDRGINPGKWTKIEGESQSETADRRKKYDKAMTDYKHNNEFINAIIPRLSNRSRRMLGLVDVII